MPNDEVADEAFAVIRKAMKKKEMVGLGRVVMHRRERLLMLERAKGIAATALRYKPEVRKEDAYSMKSHRQSAARHAAARRAHPRAEEGTLRSGEIRGPLRGCARHADQGKARRQGAADPAAEAVQCDQLMDALRRRVKGEKGGSPRAAHGRSDSPPRQEEDRKAQAPEEGELKEISVALENTAEAQVRRHRRAARPQGQAWRQRVRDPEACGARLHYDLRLELDGVMKSWAVTRGPSLVPGEKRLAVHVEDHPIEYNDFEGTIPKGQYGGGTVMIWDRGRWIPEGDPQRGLAKGHLDFALDGRS